MELRSFYVLILVVISAHLNSAQQENVTDLRCPPNLRYDEATGNCLKFCAPPCNDSELLKDVTNEGRDMYLTVSQRSADADQPIANNTLPACKVATFRNKEITSLTADSVKITIGKISASFDQFLLSRDNSSVTLSYPLSPQLLQCKLKRLFMPNYVTLANRVLMNVITNETIGFRDYYINETNGEVLGCTEPIADGRKLRCNYVIYPSDEYVFSENNISVYLKPTNETIYRPLFTEVANTSGSINLCYPASPNFTLCPKLWFLEKNEFEIAPDHRLYSFSHQKTYDLGDFFIHTDKRPVVCANIQPLPHFDYFLIHASLYVVSAICLLVAFVVHLMVPSLNYHAKPLLCHMLSLLVLYTSLAVRKFKPGIEPGPCYLLFITAYASALASFFWLSVLAFDLWSIFANMQTSSRIGCRPWTCGSKEKRFYYYSAYAWGLPVLLCIIAVVLDTTPSLQDALSLYPNISRMCWFNNRKTMFLMLYGPMFLILTINITLFVLTVANLRRASKGAEVVNKKLNQQLLFVCIRLFIVMGLCWIVEAISWALNLEATTLYIPDIIMSIQGIVIFAIYICKPTTYRILRRKFSSSSERQRSTETRWTTDSSKNFCIMNAAVSAVKSASRGESS